MDAFKQLEREFKKAAALTDQEVADLYRTCECIRLQWAKDVLRSVRLGICSPEQETSLRKANESQSLLNAWEQGSHRTWQERDQATRDRTPYEKELRLTVLRACIELDKQKRSRFARIKARVRHFFS